MLQAEAFSFCTHFSTWWESICDDGNMQMKIKTNSYSLCVLYCQWLTSTPDDVAQTRCYLASTAVFFNEGVASSAQAVHYPRLNQVPSFPLRCFQYRFYCLYCRKNSDFVINSITVQQDATYSVYYISVGSSTCFGCWHSSSGARTTVIRASGID